MNDTVFGIEVDGEAREVSLADIAGLDMTAVEEFRGGFTVTPEGIFEWRILGATLGEMSWTDQKSGDEITAAICDFDLECIACRRVKDSTLAAEDMMGMAHRERFFIRDLLKDLGRIKAFLQDMGMQGQGKLNDLLDSAIGHEFVCAIKHRKDRNDPDKLYGNVDFATVEPLAPKAATGSAGGLQLGLPAGS